MSAPLEIRYLPTAEADLMEIFDYVIKDKPSAASALLETFDTTVSQLAIFPELGTVPKDARLQRIGYRILIVEKHLVFYVVKEECVQIRRIIHGARQYGFLL